MFSKRDISIAQRIVECFDLMAALDIVAELRQKDELPGVPPTDPPPPPPAATATALQKPPPSIEEYLTRLHGEKGSSPSTLKTEIGMGRSFSSSPSWREFVNGASSAAARANRARFVIRLVRGAWMDLEGADIAELQSISDEVAKQVTLGEKVTSSKKRPRPAAAAAAAADEAGGADEEQQPPMEEPQFLDMKKKVDDGASSLLQMPADAVSPLAIFGILLPARRLDVLSIQIFDTGNDIPDDFSGNSFAKDSRRLVFGDYKTVARYGVQSYTLTADGCPELSAFIPADRINKAGDALCARPAGPLFPQATAIKNPSVFFNRNLGMSVCTLRHYWATWGVKEVLPKDRRAYLKLTNWMGHCPSTAIQIYADLED